MFRLRVIGCVQIQGDMVHHVQIQCDMVMFRFKVIP